MSGVGWSVCFLFTSHWVKNVLSAVSSPAESEFSSCVGFEGQQPVMNIIPHSPSPCAAEGEEVEPWKEGGMEGMCF